MKKREPKQHLMSVFLNWNSKSSSKSKVSYFQHHCFSVHQEVMGLQIPS